MKMKLSKKRSLLHISTIALSGLLFTNSSGVMNAAESNDVSNQQSIEHYASDASQEKVENKISTNTTHVADAATDQPRQSDSTRTANTDAGADTNTKRSNATNVDQSNNSQQSTQKEETPQSTAAHESQTGKDDSTKSENQTSSHADLPEAGHVDHPEQGAVIAIIIGIVISTIVLFKSRRLASQK